MSDKFEPLIKAWADRVISDNNTKFIYNGSVISAESLAILFYEQITKRALKKLSACIASTDLEIDKYPELGEMIECIAPISVSIFEDRYIHADMDDEDSDVTDNIPEKAFSNWVVYILENDVLPFASNLESVFIDENQEEDESEEGAPEEIGSDND